jgi:hypothetical protein
VEQAEKIIRHVGADEVIFLGDYFDDFNDDVEMVRETSAWLCNSVNMPNRIHLWGNHDVHYGYSYQRFQCSGYADWKYWVIHENVERKVLDKLIWYHFLDNKFLLSHAGLHKLHVPEEILNLHPDRPVFYKAIKKFLDDAIIHGFRAAANSTSHWVFGAGASRGGCQRVGGITWCDFEREFHPIKGLNQILGHTPQGFGTAKWCYWKGNSRVTYHPINSEWSPKPEDYDDVQRSYNLDLDVHGNTHWALWDGKGFTFGNYRDNL